MYVLRNCTLIPALTEGTDLTRADILLRDGKIEKIVPCGAKPDGAYTEMDVRGATVMPGLIDAHTHLRMIGEKTSDPLKPCAVTLDEWMFAQYYLDNGYTTVRDVGDNIAGPAIALRDHINAGKLQGPRIFCSGPTLTPTELGFDAAWSVPHHFDVNSPYAMRERVRYCIQQGSDFIKLYGSGSMMIENGQPGALIMEPDEMEEAVKLAARKNTYCAIHAHGTETCELAARTGVRTIEHASFISEDTLQYLEGTAAAGQGLVLTVSLLHGPSLKRRPDLAEKLVQHLRCVKNYKVLVGWGTDTGLEFYRAYPYLEFQVRKDVLGFSNIEILKQATINTAILIDKGAVLGSVKEGKCADLLVIDGNPAEEIEAMYQKPLHVFKGGALIR